MSTGGKSEVALKVAEIKKQAKKRQELLQLLTRVQKAPLAWLMPIELYPVDRKSRTEIQEENVMSKDR